MGEKARKILNSIGATTLPDEPPRSVGGTATAEGMQQAAIQVCVDADAECKQSASEATDQGAARIWRARAAQARQIAADISALPLGGDDADNRS